MKLTLRKTRVMAEGTGGGLFSYAGNISLYDTWFMDNQAEWGGGVNSVYTLVWRHLLASYRLQFTDKFYQQPCHQRLWRRHLP